MRFILCMNKKICNMELINPLSNFNQYNLLPT